MATPLAKAANRGGNLAEDPSTEAPPPLKPNELTYFWIRVAVSAFEPLSASPKPSSRDFLPSSIVSSGMSDSCVLTANSATCAVRFCTLGNGSPHAASALVLASALLLACADGSPPNMPTPTPAPPAVHRNSRRFILFVR